MIRHLLSCLNVRAAHKDFGGRRTSRVELLERRRVLTAAPTVVDLSIASTEWSSEFVDYLESNNLGDGGYSIPVGSSSQTAPLPWNNIDQIRITFSEDVDVDQADLSVSGVNNTLYETSDFSYDSSSHTAIWTLAESLVDDLYHVDLDSDGLDPVVDVDENLLDGEWSNGSSTYASGNGTAGGDFEFQFQVLEGDVDSSELVTVGDYFTTRLLDGKDTEDATYDAMRDVDGSGDIDSGDWLDVWGNLGSSTPTGTPAGEDNDAPTTAGFSDIVVNDDAVDEEVSLFDAFDDLEDADGDLTFEVVSNSNSGLFDATTINGTTGILTLDFVADANGEADLVIRATDTEGLIVDATLHVEAQSVNDPPVISNFVGVNTNGDFWTFTGTVADSDDDPTGWTVIFGGVLDGYTTTVLEDDTFVFAVELDPSTFGLATAQTEDDEGLDSNVATFFVGVT